MKIKLLALSILITAISCKNDTTSTITERLAKAEISLVDYVNPLMGTDSEFSLSNGNTYPA